jgi:hypothetical protein
MDKNFDKYDWLGVFSASLCTLHCLAAPFIITLNQFQFLGIGFFWSVLNYLFLVLSAMAIFKCTHQNNRPFLKLIQWMALIMLAICVAFHPYLELLDTLLYVASAILVCVHLINIYLHRFKID